MDRLIMDNSDQVISKFSKRHKQQHIHRMIMQGLMRLESPSAFSAQQPRNVLQRSVSMLKHISKRFLQRSYASVCQLKRCSHVCWQWSCWRCGLFYTASAGRQIFMKWYQ